MNAAGIGATRIVGAGILIVAIEGVAGHALAAIAMVILGAYVTVAARLLVGRVHTPGVGVARVVGADVAVATGHGVAAAAHAVLANLTVGACVPVFAQRQVVEMHTPDAGHAGVVGASIAVVAVGSISAQAHSLVAHVTQGAGVTIVTERLIVGVNASQFGAARIIGAGITVVTILPFSGYTGAVGAGVAGSTLTAIITGESVGHELAACVRIA